MLLSFKVLLFLLVLTLLSVVLGCGSDAGSEPSVSSLPGESTPVVVPEPAVSVVSATVTSPTEFPVVGVTVNALSETLVPLPTSVAEATAMLSTLLPLPTAVAEATVMRSTPAPLPVGFSTRAPTVDEGAGFYSIEDETTGVRSPVSGLGLSAESGRGGDSRPHPELPHRPGVQAEALTAGEVDDNRLWGEYLRYLEKGVSFKVREVDVSLRYSIRVTDGFGRPLANAKVVVSAGDEELWDGVTYGDGETYFYPLALFPQVISDLYGVRAELDGRVGFAKFASGSDGVEVVLEEGRTWNVGVPLDVLFLVDSTGSMADEIKRIKETLVSISERIDALPSRPDLRFGMVVYRDRGDDYVTRTFGFTRGVLGFVRDVRRVSAEGGGDYPESLNEALHVVVGELDWRLGEGARLVFMFADAPPHLDYSQDYDYSEEMRIAHRRGIKIFPIASSGLDPQGEYIFRQIGQYTKGRFLFLLYGGDTTHSVEQYTVNKLDDLVVRLVEEEMAHFGAVEVDKPE